MIDMESGKGKSKPIFWRLRPAERQVILLIGDLLVGFLALAISIVIWSREDWLRLSFSFLTERTPTWFFLAPFIWMLLTIELYDVRRASRRSETLKGVAIAAGVSLGLYLLIYFTSEPNSLPRRGVSVFILAVSLLILLWRFIYIRVFTAPVFMRRVLVIGAGRAGENLVQVIDSIWPLPFYLVGLIDDDPAKQNMKYGNHPVLGSSQQLLEIIERERITDLVFAISGEMNPAMFQAVLMAEERGVEVTTMPLVYEELLGRVPILLLQSDWILRSFVDQAHTNNFFEMAKRLMDIIGGLIGCIGLALLYPIIAVLILLDDGAPVLYSQERLGKNGKPYQIIKFRTMVKDAEKDGKARVAVKNDSRVTRIGRLLRKSHLDELPQFWSVLRGEMSMVGPRAERVELVNSLQTKVPFYRARLFVKPGLTGWAQVNYGYAETVEDTIVKLEYDLYYIKHRNLMLDLLIIFRTAGTVFGLRGQ
ncbi:MAG: sugar transferase [Chloroflexi bacterium]|nr:sugar transferase [Chloroflexota bacterium]